MLSSAAGFQQFRRSDSRSSNPSAQGVTLRALGGNATSRTLVLLDGVPMADPMFGYVPLSALAPERLSSVRVTRGGGAGAFGAGAVAGAIELTSADADTLGFLSGSALASDRGDSELSATLAPRLGQGFAVASARWDRGKGFWTTPEAQRGPASVRARYDSWSASLRMVQPLGTRLRAAGSRTGFRRQAHAALCRGGHLLARAGRQPAAGRTRGLAARCTGLSAGARFLQHCDQRQHLPKDPRPAQHALDRLGRQTGTAPAGWRGPCAALRGGLEGRERAS